MPRLGELHAFFNDQSAMASKQQKSGGADTAVEVDQIVNRLSRTMVTSKVAATVPAKDLGLEEPDSVAPTPQMDQEDFRQDEPAAADSGRKQRQDKGPGGPRVLSIEGAASHLIGAATGWLFMHVARAIRGKQRRLHKAQAELEAQLAARDAALEAASGQLQQATDREVVIQEQVQEQASAAETAAAQAAAANARCQEAAANLERTMNDLRMTQAELQAARTQLQEAMDQMANVSKRSEVAEGELGLTKSENELLRRELTRMRTQLEGASQALERHRLGSRAATGARAAEAEGGFLGGGAWEDEELGASADDVSSLGGTAATERHQVYLHWFAQPNEAGMGEGGQGGGSGGQHRFAFGGMAASEPP